MMTKFLDTLFIDLILLATVVVMPLIVGVQAGRVTHWTVGAVLGVLLCSLVSAGWWVFGTHHTSEIDT